MLWQLQGGGIYLNAVKSQDGGDEAQAVTLAEFHQILLRIARMSFSQVGLY
jgi:hypothetical protein